MVITGRRDLGLLQGRAQVLEFGGCEDLGPGGCILDPKLITEHSLCLSEGGDMAGAEWSRAQAQYHRAALPEPMPSLQRVWWLPSARVAGPTPPFVVPHPGATIYHRACSGRQTSGEGWLNRLGAFVAVAPSSLVLPKNPQWGLAAVNPKPVGNCC